MQNQWVDLYRNGMRTATDVARVSLESGIRMHEKQLQIARDILQEQSSSMEEISRAGSVQELLALQSRLAGTQFGRMVELWSNVWQTAAQTQAQGLREIQTFASRSSQDVARAAGSVAESADAANQERKAAQRRSA